MAKNQRPINIIDAEFSRTNEHGQHIRKPNTINEWLNENKRFILIMQGMLMLFITGYVMINDSKDSDAVKIARQQTYQKSSEEKIAKSNNEVRLAELEKGAYASNSPQITTTCVITAEDRANGKKFYFKPNCPRTTVEPLPPGTPFERQLLVMKKGDMKGFEGSYRMIKILPPGVEETICQTLNPEASNFISDNCQKGIKEQSTETYLLIYFEKPIVALQ